MYQPHLFRTLISAAAVTSVVTSGAPAAVAAFCCQHAPHGHAGRWRDLGRGCPRVLERHDHPVQPRIRSSTAQDAPDPELRPTCSASATRWSARHTPVRHGGRSRRPLQGPVRFARCRGEKSPSRPRRTIAWGRVDGRPGQCRGNTGGPGPDRRHPHHLRSWWRARCLNNYQLDGEYALNELLAPSQHIQLVLLCDSGPGQRCGRRLWPAWREHSQPPKAGHASRWLPRCLTSRPGSAAPRRQRRPTTQHKRNNKLTS